MKLSSYFQRGTTRRGFLWLAVFFGGITAVFLPRAATSTLTRASESRPAAVSLRQITLATKDLVYDPLTQRIYASVPSSAGGIGNSITQIDPVPGTIGASVSIGSEPGKLAISDNSQYIYASLDGVGAVRRFDLTTQTVGLQFALGTGPSGTFFVEDMGVMPGQPDTVAIARFYSSTSHAGVAIYDNGVARPTTTATFPVNNVIEFSATASRIYGYNNRSSGFDFSKLAVDASGVSIASTVPSLITGFDAGMVFQNGRIYSTRGKVVDPETSVQVGTYPGVVQGSLVLPDSSVNRVYFLARTDVSTFTLKEFDRITFVQTGSLTITGTSGNPGSLIKWGTDGLAFRTSGNQVYFLSTSEIVPIAATPIPSPSQLAAGVIRLPLAANDLIFDSNTQQVFATVPSTAGSFGNSIVPVTPETGVMGTPVFIGSEPKQLAIADSGQHIYAGLDGAASVRRFDTVTQTPGLQFSLGSAGFNGPRYVDDIAVLPGTPNSVAISRRNVGTSPRHEGVGIYDDGVVRSTTTPGHTGAAVIEFSSLASTLYGYNNEGSDFGLYKMAVSGSGVSVVSIAQSVISGFGVDIRYDNGLLYATSGRVVNPETNSLIGMFSGASGLVLPDTVNGKVYFLNNSTLTVYDPNTFVQTGSLTVPGVSGTPASLIKWGANGLAFRTETQVFFISISAIPPVVTAFPQPIQIAAGVIELPLATRDMIYDSNTQKVYASLPGSAGTFGNSIAAIDPMSGVMSPPTFVGSEPGKVVISSNKQYIYTSLDGAGAVRRLEVTSQTSGLQFPLGRGATTGIFFVEDIATVPGDANAVAVSRRNLGISPKHEGVGVYDSGVLRPVVTSLFSGISNVIEFSSSASTLYGHNNETSEAGFRKMNVDANGVSITSTLLNLIVVCCADIKYDTGRVYVSTGRVIDPEAGTIVGTFSNVNSQAFVPDSSINRAFFASGNGATATIQAFDSNTFLPAGFLSIPGVEGQPANLIRWGTNGLAFRTTANKLYFVQTTLVTGAPNLLVNSLTDLPDLNIGDGHCDTDGNLGNGDQCTLRAAIQEANASATNSAITFDASLNGGSIFLNTALDAINNNITITGPGAQLLTVLRTTAPAPDFRVFTINSGKTVTISGLTISNGQVTGISGGGISNSGVLTLNDVTVSLNSASGSGGTGGGIQNLNTLTINNCVVSGNAGGGIASSVFGSDTTVTINSSVISGNTVNGGLRNLGFNSIATMAINNSTISGNSTSNSGGGIYNSAGSFSSRGLLTINNSTISGNNAAQGGGGLYSAAVFGNAATEVNINNSTISGNADSSTMGGGGIYHLSNGIGSNATLTITNGTIFGNNANAGNGGGILTAVLNSTTNLNLRNTIVANNRRSSGTLASDISASVDPASSFNLISDGTDMTGVVNGANGNQVGTVLAPINALLGPLANNGGPTLTHALLVASPALDAATDVPLTTLNGAILDSTTSINVTDAVDIPGGVGFTIVVDSEQLIVLGKSGNTLTVVRGANGTTAAAHANSTSLYSAFDQRGPGFLRKRDSADPDTVAIVDIGAVEAQASIEDITDKLTVEDAPLSFSFNVGDSAAITSVTASSSDTTLVPNNSANINVTGSGSTRTLNITPAADRFGTSTITVTVNTASESISDTFVLTVSPVADTPSVTNATANEDSQTFSGLVITRNAADGAEVTHFKITGITNGTLLKNNNVTPINNGDFILVSEGGAGLRFHPSPNFFGTGSFNVQSSVGNTDAGLGGSIATATITVNPVAETPSVTNATTTINTQTSSGLVITGNPIDGAEVTHFRIESIQNGQLFKNDGVTQITNFTTITLAEGAAGLKFTPALNLFSPATTFSFQVRGATSASGNGLGAAATATITVSCNATSEVTNTNDGGAGSLRDAILQACPGNVITFNIPASDPGFSGGVYTITLSGELTIVKNLTITGLGAQLLTVQRSTAAAPRFRIFTVNSGATVSISGLTITNGHTADGVPGPGTVSGGSGGGISNSGTLTLTNVIVSGNRTGIGSSSDLGAAGGRGGGIHNEGTLTLNNCTVSGNTTGVGGPGGQGGHGGGISSFGTVALNDSIISGNQSGNGGPGSAGGAGGGIFCSGASTMTLTGSTVSSNQTGEGGMVAGPGGGIACNGTLTMTNSTVSGNRTGNGGNGNGGGISSSGSLILVNSTVSDNVTGTNAGGAGIYAADGTISLTSSILSGNQTSGGGGGINSFRPVTITDCSITGNSSSTGGGLLLGSINPSAVVNTTISGNNSTGIGGGMWASGSNVFTNLTITNNRSDSDNSGGEQGGGFYPQGPQSINNSLVAGNFRGSSPSTTADDIAGTLNAASSFNLIGTGGSGGLTDGINNNLVGVADPHIGPLAGNGGLTQTHALLLNSAALDAGNNALVSNPPFSGPPFTDQRGLGFARIVDGSDADTTDTVDIGAYEAQVSLPDLADQTINEDGSLSVPFNVGGAASITSVTATSSDITLVPNNPANISISGSGSTRTLLINPVANASGTSTITVAVNGNNSQTMTDTFLLTVNSVNDAPSFLKGSDQTVNENVGVQTVNGWATSLSAGPANESGQTLNFVIVGNSNASLFAVAPVVSPTGTLTYTPATGVSGTALITVALMDNGGTTNGGINTSGTQTFNINVLEGGALQFSSAAFSTAEDGVSAVITVTRTGGTAGEARVNYATSNGTATAGQDYTTASGTLIFADGITSQSFNVPITNDAVDEPDETINLTLTSPAGSGSLGTPAAAVLTISDNDPIPGLSIDNTAANEGDSGTATMTFTVALSGPSSQTVTVDYATANGTATAGSDYLAASGTLTFLPLETTKPINVTVNGDINFEPNETFVVNLTSPVNATIAESQGAAQITNDDAQGGFIAFSQSLYTVGESGGFTTITVNRTNDLSGAATVEYFTRDYTDSATIAPCNTISDFASSRCDYTSASGTLRFAAGETSKTFLILISQDSFVEFPESLGLTLSNATGGALFGNLSTASLMITDDATEPSTNPIDSADAFVRQHYHDFLNREPDAAGLAFWSNQITECQQPGATCSAEVRRINVSAAFFLSIEFQETGYLAYRFYKSAYGNISGAPVPLRFSSEFLPDTQQLGKDVVIGQPGAAQQLEANKAAYALDFVSRSRFTSAYPTTLTPAEFVDALFANAVVTPSATDRDAAINEFAGAGNISDTAARGRALRRVADNSILKQQETNQAFVLMQYFGYLRRNPNDAPESGLNFAGYNFWLGKLNQFNGNFVNAEMVKAFITAGEYRHRFGP